ncbi:MAG: hypothetical protein JWN67_4871 [Actinomycetia bacterium]|nr:hypothetical protein [Actinomycetes bacterium]
MAELLLGDDPPPPKGRSRWVDSAGLGAVVAVILAIGILGDRGAKGDRPAPTTTSTTVAPATGPRPDPTSTVPPGPVVLGPTLAEPTGTSLLVLGTSTPRLLDLDTGTLHEVTGASGFDAVGLRGGFVLTDPNGLGFLPADGSPVRAFDADSRRLQGRVASSDPDRVWLATESDDGGLLAREYDAGGRSTGRQLSLPRSATIEEAVDDGLVVSQAGSLTFVDATDGRGHDLGRGNVVAAKGRTLARLTCVVLRCRLELVDVRTGRATPVDDLPPAAQGFGTFSPAGRWLAVTLIGGNERAFLVVIDVVGHRLGTTIGDGDAFAFASDDVLVVAARDGLRSYQLPEGTGRDVPVTLPAVQRLVAAPTR